MFFLKLNLVGHGDDYSYDSDGNVCLTLPPPNSNVRLWNTKGGFCEKNPLPPIWTTFTTFFQCWNSRLESQFGRNRLLFLTKNAPLFFSQDTVPNASLPSSVLSTKKSSSNCLAFVPIRVKNCHLSWFIFAQGEIKCEFEGWSPCNSTCHSIEING